MKWIDYQDPISHKERRGFVVYRDAEDGPCKICMLQEEMWKDRVHAESLIYNSKFRVKIEDQV